VNCRYRVLQIYIFLSITFTNKFLTRENVKVNDKITGRRHILRTLLILHKLTLSFLIDIPSLCPGCLLKISNNFYVYVNCRYRVLQIYIFLSITFTIAINRTLTNPPFGSSIVLFQLQVPVNSHHHQPRSETNIIMNQSGSETNIIMNQSGSETNIIMKCNN
jgi:hypothetical protein